MRIILDTENFEDTDSVKDIFSKADSFTVISDGKEIVVTPDTKVLAILKLTVKPKKPSFKERAAKWLSEE